MKKYSLIYILVLGFSCFNTHAAKHGDLYFCTKEDFQNDATKKAATFSFYTNSKNYKKDQKRDSAKSWGLSYCFIGSKSGSYYLPIASKNSYKIRVSIPVSEDHSYVEISKSTVLEVLNNLKDEASQYTFIAKLNQSYQELCDQYKRANFFDGKIKFIKSPNFYTKKKITPFESVETQTILIEN